MPILSGEEIRNIVEEIKNDARIAGILLTGSYAYGEPKETSDLDLRCVTNDHSSWAEFERMRFGVPVEVFFNPPDVIREYMQKSKAEGHGDCIHFWTYGKILYDPEGMVTKLQQEAKNLWEAGPSLGKSWQWRWEKHKKYNEKFGYTGQTKLR